MKKITKATFKAFIRKNNGNVYHKTNTTFCGMVDGCINVNDGFKKASKTEHNLKNTCGIDGVWLVGSSRNLFNEFENDNYKGIEYYNCCGNGIIAIKK